MAEPPPYPGTPRWAKVFGIVVIVVVVVFVVLLVSRGPGGRHGPGLHMGGEGGSTPASSPARRTAPKP